MRERISYSGPDIFIPALFLILFFVLGPNVPGAGSAETPEAAESVQGPDSGEKRSLSDPVAIVNGVKISGFDFKKAVDQRIPQLGHGTISRKRMAEIGGEVLNTLIVQEILFQEARRQNIRVDPDEIEAEVKKIQERFGSEVEYRRTLRLQELTRDDIRAGVERHLAVQELSEREVRSRVSIGEQEMRNYYNDHPEQFQRPQQIRLRILLVHVDPSARVSDWEEALERAQGYADRARQGDDFESLVQEYSDEPSAEATAGDTGLLHEGRLPYSALDPIVFGQGVGSIGDPVQTLYGYVVYRVEEKKPAQQLAFENLNKDLLREELEASESQKKFEEWVDGLRAKAEVEIY